MFDPKIGNAGVIVPVADKEARFRSADEASKTLGHHTPTLAASGEFRKIPGVLEDTKGYWGSWDVL